MGTPAGRALPGPGRRGVRAALTPPTYQRPRDQPRARRTHCAAAQNPDQAGYDAGAATIAEHLARDPAVTNVPAVSTIWRILSRAASWPHNHANAPAQPGNASAPTNPTNSGKPTSPTGTSPMTPAPKSSTCSTTTPAWPSPAYTRPTIAGPDVIDIFTAAFTRWGTPAAVLTDNGAIFTATPRRGGRTALQVILGELGIKYFSSRPYHPQTCGKVERFHQTLKKRLPAQPPAQPSPNSKTNSTTSPATTTPCAPTARCRRHTPCRPSTPGPKPSPPATSIPPHYRVRHDRIDAAGVITIRYNSRLHHIGLCKRRRGTHVIVLINNRDIRVLDRHTGQLIRKLTLDPTRDYQPRGIKCGNSPENRLKV